LTEPNYTKKDYYDAIQTKIAKKMNSKNAK